MLENIPLGYYSSAGLLNFITSAILAIVVFFKNPKSRTNRTFFFFSFAVAGWSLCYFLWLRTEDSRVAEIYLRTLMLFVIFIPTTFTHFILTLLRADVAKRINPVNYSISFLLGFTVYTRFFASDIGPFLVFPYWLKPRILFLSHTVHFFANTIYSHTLILRALKRSSGTLRNQLLYVFIGTSIGYAAGAINYLTWYRVPIPPFLNPLVSVYVASITYAIVKHQLMDIEVIIRRTVVFAGLVASVVGVVSLVAFVSQDLLGRYIGISRAWSNIFAAMIIAMLYGKIREWLVNATDRYLFQKKYDYRELLRRFTDEVLSVLDLRKLETLTVDTLTETVRLENCALLLANRVTGRFELAASAGLGDRSITLEGNHPLVEFLQRSQEPFDKKQEVAGKPKEALAEAMAQLKAEVCFPLSLREDLVGILALGRKKSGGDYTKEDMDVLMALAGTEAIAISNALLAAEVAQKEKLSVIGTLTAAINHEVCNPLSNVRVQAEECLLDFDQGFLNQASQEDQERVREFLKMTAGEIDRAVAITARLSNFAKPAREPTSEPVDVEKAANEVLGVLGHDLELRGIAVEKVVSPGILPIWADRKQLHEILFNLVRNAGQAIERTGKVTVQAKMNGTAKVAIQVSDTGCGIPAEQMQRLFTPFFTTKQEGQGTGLGLFVVKQLVERNGGTIDVVSHPGTGTTFTVEFPVANP